MCGGAFPGCCYAVMLMALQPLPRQWNPRYLPIHQMHAHISDHFAAFQLSHPIPPYVLSLQRGRSGALLMLTRCPVYSTTGSRVDPPLLSLSHTLSQEHHGLNLPDVQSVWRICLFSISISAWCIAMSTFKQIRTHCSNRYNMKNK